MQQVRPSVYNLPQNPMNHRSYKCNYIKARVETVRMDFVRSQNQNQNFKVQPSGGGNASFNTTAGAGDTNLYGGGITANQDLLSGSMLSTGGLQPSARAAAGTAVDQRAATATTAADGKKAGGPSAISSRAMSANRPVSNAYLRNQKLVQLRKKEQ